MQRQEKEGLVWLTYDLFSDCPRLTHGVFLRHGGVSSGDFASLNFGSLLGDAQENILENKRRALAALKLTRYTQVFQKHDVQIVKADPLLFQEADGQMTQETDLALLTLHADCQSAIFYDPIHHVIANVHCGWRGNVKNIYRETVLKLRDQYGSNPADILVGISPSLGPENAQFIHYRRELPQPFWSFQWKPDYFNLWEISRWQLLECGILPHHVEIAEICTHEHTEDYFSYRRMKTSGRHGTFVAMSINPKRAF